MAAASAAGARSAPIDSACPLAVQAGARLYMDVQWGGPWPAYLSVSLIRYLALTQRTQNVILQVVRNEAGTVQLWERAWTSESGESVASLGPCQTDGDARKAFDERLKRLTGLTWANRKSASHFGKFNTRTRFAWQRERLVGQAERNLSSAASVQSMQRLSPIHWQLVMQHCDALSLLCLAATCKQLAFDATQPFPWKHASAMEVAFRPEAPPPAPSSHGAAALQFISSFFNSSSDSPPPVATPLRPSSFVPVRVDAVGDFDSRPKSWREVKQPSRWSDLSSWRPTPPLPVVFPPPWMANVIALRIGPLHAEPAESVAAYLRSAVCKTLRHLGVVDFSKSIDVLEGVLATVAPVLVSLVVEEWALSADSAAGPKPAPLSLKLPALRHLCFADVRDSWSAGTVRGMVRLATAAPNVDSVTFFSTHAEVGSDRVWQVAQQVVGALLQHRSSASFPTVRIVYGVDRYEYVRHEGPGRYIHERAGDSEGRMKSVQQLDHLCQQHVAALQRTADRNGSAAPRPGKLQFQLIYLERDVEPPNIRQQVAIQAELHAAESRRSAAYAQLAFVDVNAYVLSATLSPGDFDGFNRLCGPQSELMRVLLLRGFATQNHDPLY